MFDFVGASSSGSPILFIVYLVVIVFEIAAFWQVFAKAGEPGWAAIIPIYNTLILLKIVGRPSWWFFLFLIPGVNIVVYFMVSQDLARSFGKGTGFGVGLWLLNAIFYPILGFGSAQYVGARAGAAV